MNKNSRKPKFSKKEFEDAKSEMLAIEILKLAKSSKLKGYMIIKVLTFCLIDVIYKTASKPDKELFEKFANNLHKVILESLLKYKELYKEQKEEKPNE